MTYYHWKIKGVNGLYKQEIILGLSEIQLEKEAMIYCKIMLNTKKQRIYKKNFKKLCRLWDFDYKDYIGE